MYWMHGEKNEIKLVKSSFIFVWFVFFSEILGRKELWNIVLCVPAFFSVVQVIVLPFLPEAPRYLFIEKGDKEACKKGWFISPSSIQHLAKESLTDRLKQKEKIYLHIQETFFNVHCVWVTYFCFGFCCLCLSLVFHIPALQTLWGQGDYKEEMDEMLAEQAANEAAPPKSPLQLLRDRTVRWQLMSMSIIYFCNQMSGMSAVRKPMFRFMLTYCIQTITTACQTQTDTFLLPRSAYSLLTSSRRLAYQRTRSVILHLVSGFVKSWPQSPVWVYHISISAPLYFHSQRFGRQRPFTLLHLLQHALVSGYCENFDYLYKINKQNKISINCITMILYYTEQMIDIILVGCL